MKKLFAPYEIAILLKGKGFDEECMAHYGVHKELYSNLSIYNNKVETSTKNSEWGKVEMFEEACAAPLYQQVVDWFRERHHVDIVACPSGVNEMDYGYNIYKDKKFIDSLIGSLPTYHQALNKAILEAIKLIHPPQPC